MPEPITRSSFAAVPAARGKAAPIKAARRVAGTVRLVVMIPPDIKLWLESRAAYFGATISSEVSRCCRARMEEAATAPADTPK
jgi:hypothetical protein